MPEPTPSNPSPAAASAGGLAGLRARLADADGASWAQLWQAPALLLGLGLFALGVYFIIPRHEPPDYEGALTAVDALIRAETDDTLAEAREKLETVAAGLETQPPADDAYRRSVRGRYWQYSGDANYLTQALATLQPVDTETARANLRLVLEQYDKSVAQGRPLDQRSLRYKAMTLVTLGREREALETVNELDPSQPQQRYGVVRELIERRMQQPGADAIALEPLLTRLEDELRLERDADKRLEQQRWVVALRARVYLDVNDPRQAILYLSKELQRLRAAGLRDAPELTILLAEAHRRLGEFDEARRHYGLAQQMLPEGDGRLADVLVGLGQIEIASGGDGYLDRAYGLYDQAVKRFPTADAVVVALDGLGHIEAMRGQYAAALERFRGAVVRLLEKGGKTDPRRAMIEATVLTHVQRATELTHYQDALDLLAVIRPFYDTALPSPMLLQYAQVHEKLGDQRMDHARQLDPLAWAGPGDPPLDARRKAFQDAATQYKLAADRYLEHARRVSIVDADAHGDSLWNAALNYDRAQAYGDAINVYDEFIHTRPVDGRQLEARHRLGSAYLAEADYDAAVGLFGNLIEEHPTNQWAYLSMVPLARAYAESDRTDQAIATLRKVVDHSPSITPTSEPYRAALIDLARTYYLQGAADPTSYSRAIETLTDALARFGDTPQGPELRYMLADSLRRSAGALHETLSDQLNERDKLAVLAERNTRYEQAQQKFRQAREALEARHELALSPLEKLYRRNAWFYEADCAYLRGDYEGAVDLYREAAERWADSPAALTALVQIVNAYCEMGQFESARTWNRRALRLLDRIDDSAFEKPDMPMTRQHWRDWLRWSAELDLFTRQAQR